LLQFELCRVPVDKEKYQKVVLSIVTAMGTYFLTNLFFLRSVLLHILVLMEIPNNLKIATSFYNIF
jgi:MFS-type transporter involved in bile tolerance (Atg22 family)